MRLLLLCILINANLYAQNLVPNGDFEDTVSCPNALSQIDRAQGWSAYSSSPDYYNSCASSSTDVYVPDNIMGHRYAASGNAYCGIINYIKNDTADYSMNREIIGRPLASSLVIGQKYFVSFQVSLIGSNMATDKIGILFSTISYTNIDSTTIPPIENFAHIYSNSIISDTVGWVRVSGSFVADSTYTHISVGNFFTNSNTDTLTFAYNPLGGGAYYLVDDIRVSTDSAFTVSVVQLPSKVNTISVYPNPSTGIIKIKLANNQQLENITVLDIYGQNVFNQLNVSNEFLDLSFLGNGLYVLTIKNNSTEYTTKLIIQK